MLKESRRTKRFPAKIAMVFNDDEGLNFSFITNISRYGVFLETEKVLPPGAKVNFVLSNSIRYVPVQGKVVRIKDAAFEGPPSGIGVEFENLHEMAKIIRDDILLYLMNFGHHQIWEQTEREQVAA